MDDYGTFPMGSRALVPHNRRPPGTLVEVKEQVQQLCLMLFHCDCDLETQRSRAK